MEFIKLEHSGCIIKQNGHAVVCDPVEFAQQLPKMENVDVIIITHKHNDHFQPEKLAQIIAENPGARIFAPQDLGVDEIAGHLIEKVEADVEWNLENFNLKFFGKDHASIIPGVVPCANIGVMINDKVVDPGDSFDLPEGSSPEVLLVPCAAPWCKVSESVDYIKTAQPKIVIPFHDAVLSSLGKGFHNNILKSACAEIGADYRALEADESTTI